MYEDRAGCITFISVLLLINLILMIVFGGNWRTEVSYSPPVTKNFSEQIPFEEDLKASHWVIGLIKGKQPDIQKSLAKYIRPGEEITELTIITRHTWLDNFLTGITVFIYCPVTVTIEGKIGRLSGSSPQEKRDSRGVETDRVID